MAYKFTPTDPIQYHNFNYTLFLDYAINSTLSQVPNISRWRENWLKRLIKEDKKVMEYINQNQTTNPYIKRLNEFRYRLKDAGEMFVYEFVSPYGGSYFFHFDIEKMKAFEKDRRLKKITLGFEQFYIDRETLYYPDSIEDGRMPYFVRMYAIPHQYIVVDGNKRVMAKLHHGFREISGYKINKDILFKSFFFNLDECFYKLLEELSAITVMLRSNIPFKEIKKTFPILK